MTSLYQCITKYGYGKPNINYEPSAYLSPQKCILWAAYTVVNYAVKTAADEKLKVCFGKRSILATEIERLVAAFQNLTKGITLADFRSHRWNDTRMGNVCMISWNIVIASSALLSYNELPLFRYKALRPLNLLEYLVEIIIMFPDRKTCLFYLLKGIAGAANVETSQSFPRNSENMSYL